MMPKSWWLILALVAAGCNGGTVEKDTTSKPAGDLAADEMEQINKLPEAERPLAISQKVCPVSNEKLGSMGVPIVRTVEGKTFFLCCKGCNGDVDKDPKAVLAKLNKPALNP